MVLFSLLLYDLLPWIKLSMWVLLLFADDGTDLILIGQYTYSEHRNSITHAKFSRSGHSIASADIDGVIK